MLQAGLCGAVHGVVRPLLRLVLGGTDRHHHGDLVRQPALRNQPGEGLLIGDHEFTVERDHLGLHPDRGDLVLEVVEDVSAGGLDAVGVEQQRLDARGLVRQDFSFLVREALLLNQLGERVVELALVEVEVHQPCLDVDGDACAVRDGPFHRVGVEDVTGI